MKQKSKFNDLITFTRASTATFLDSDGLLKTAANNFLLNSETFSSWDLSRASVTSSSLIDPFGGNNSTSFKEIALTGVHNVYTAQTTETNVEYTFSIWVKADGRNLVKVMEYESGNPKDFIVDLRDGSIENVAGIYTVATVEDSGNGWWKLTVARNVTSTNTFFVIRTVLDDGTDNFTGDATKGVLIYGAHAYRSDFPVVANAIGRSDKYVKTTSSVKHEPRIEYDAAGNRLGLLVEESRTNYVDYSNYIDPSISNWTKANIIGTGNASLSPDGTANAISLIEDTATNIHSVYQAGIVTDKTMTFSVYAKDNGRNCCQLRVASIGFNQAYCNFDLQNGVTGSSGGGSLFGSSIESVGNGWYRISIRIDGSGATIGFELCLVDGPNADERQTYTGDGTSGIYVYSFQFEEGNFITSPIPTSGSTATRSADVASIGVSDFGFNQAEGTLFVECNLVGGATTLDINDNTTSNRILINSRRAGVSSTSGAVVAGGVVTGSFSNLSGASPSKVSLAYKTNDFATSANGSAVATDSSGGLPTGLTVADIGNNPSDQIVTGHIKSIKYWPRRLTNAQLQELTS